MALRRLRVLFVVLVTGCAPQPAPREAGLASARGEETSSSYVKTLRARTFAPLSLDAHLQEAVEHALLATKKAGAVLAIEPDTGAVRAIFSVPGDRGDPLLVADVPASTFKPFAAFAGLEVGAIDANSMKECTGTFPFGGKELSCSMAHGKLTTSQSIYRSCNSFYYSVAISTGHARLLDMARRFGFGAPTGIELSEQLGVVEDEARAREIASDPTSPVPLLDAAGHGEIKVTLLQLARAYAAIANGGKIVRLGLSHGGIERSIALRPVDLELVRGALVEVVANDAGTAHVARIPGFPFAGKTGSADSPPLHGGPGGEDLFFVAYAPPANPKILVAARIERTDKANGPLAVVKEVLEAWR